jgi:hypothetical protein
VRAVDTVTVPGRNVQSLQIGHQFETRDAKCDYSRLRVVTLTLGLSGLRAALSAQRTARTPADPCALGSESAAAAVDGFSLRAERRQPPVIEQRRQEITECGELVNLRFEFYRGNTPIIINESRRIPKSDAIAA